jgi:dTDP-glucose 4,6-dehydratase
MRYAICPDKIATDLGWFPVTPFSEGIRKTIAWYLDNRDWTRSVTSGQYREYYKRMYENR